MYIKFGLVLQAFNVFMQKLWSSDWQHVRYDGILVGEIFRGMQHQKRRKGGCSGGLVVASLKEVRGLLSRFDCVYSDCITQGCPGGALAVAMSLRARCFCFQTHLQPMVALPSTGNVRNLPCQCPTWRSCRAVSASLFVSAVSHQPEGILL